MTAFKILLMQYATKGKLKHQQQIDKQHQQRHLYNLIQLNLLMMICKHYN